MQPKPKRPPCRRPPPYTTPAAPRRAQRRNARNNREVTRTDRRVRSLSRMKRKEGLNHDATGREINQHLKSKERPNNKTNTKKLRTRCLMQPRPRRPPCRRPPPHTTPAAPNRAHRRNAQRNGEATITDRRVKSRSRMQQKEGRHHDATGR